MTLADSKPSHVIRKYRCLAWTMFLCLYGSLALFCLAKIATIFMTSPSSTTTWERSEKISAMPGISFCPEWSGKVQYNQEPGHIVVNDWKYPKASLCCSDSCVDCPKTLCRNDEWNQEEWASGNVGQTCHLNGTQQKIGGNRSSKCGDQPCDFADCMMFNTWNLRPQYSTNNEFTNQLDLTVSFWVGPVDHTMQDDDMMMSVLVRVADQGKNHQHSHDIARLRPMHAGRMMVESYAIKKKVVNHGTVLKSCLSWMGCYSTSEFHGSFVGSTPLARQVNWDPENIDDADGWEKGAVRLHVTFDDAHYQVVSLENWLGRIFKLFSNVGGYLTICSTIFLAAFVSEKKEEIKKRTLRGNQKPNNETYAQFKTATSDDEEAVSSE